MECGCETPDPISASSVQAIAASLVLEQERIRMLEELAEAQAEADAQLSAQSLAEAVPAPIPPPAFEAPVPAPAPAPGNLLSVFISREGIGGTGAFES